MSTFVSTIKQFLTSKLTLTAFVTTVIVFFFISFIFKGTSGMPCYCEKCEHKLINEAMNGDPAAQQKLQNAVYNAEVTGPVAVFGKGAFGFIMLLAVILAVISFVAKMTQQSTQSVASTYLNPVSPVPIV